MDLISGLIYGITQGLTEFLPISSSGHLAILPFVLKIKDPGVLFDLSMHAGTALSVIVYFKNRIKTLLRTPKNPLVYNLTVATISTFILAFLIEGVASHYGRNPFLIAFNLFFFGILMWMADAISKPSHQTFSLKGAIIIGLSQALAIFPGVSRSGITLTAARSMGISRTEATQFSFLLSLPVVIAGLFFKLPDFFESSLNFDPWICLFGVITSFSVGLFAIHFFFHSIKKWGLAPFAIYRISLALGLCYFSIK